VAALLTQQVAQPLAQVLASHPQRRHPEAAADPIEGRQGRFSGEEHPPGEMALPV
jgi:hypothetical protein